MPRQPAGLTTVELILAALIVASLAVAGVAMVANKDRDAKLSTARAVASSAATAGALNYSSCAVSRHRPGDKCTKVDECADIPALLPDGVPKGFAIVASGVGSGSNATQFLCSVEARKADRVTPDQGVAYQDFSVTAAGN